MPTILSSVFADRQQGVVAGGELLAQHFRRPPQIERFDLVARHHHVVHRDAVEVHQVEQHLLVAVRHVLLRLQHHHAHLFQVDLLAAAVGLYLDVEQPQHVAHDGRGDGDHRVEQLDEDRQQIARKQRHAFRVAGRDDLGHDFAEHQNDEGDGQRARHQRHAVAGEQAQHDDFGERRRRDIEQRVAEQDGAEQLVRLRQQL